MCVWLVLPWGEDPECRCLLSWAWCWDCGFPKCHPEADLLHDLLSKMFLPGPISVPRHSLLHSPRCSQAAGLEQGNKQGFK